MEAPWYTGGEIDHTEIGSTGAWHVSKTQDVPFLQYSPLIAGKLCLKRLSSLAGINAIEQVKNLEYQWYLLHIYKYICHLLLCHDKSV